MKVVVLKPLILARANGGEIALIERLRWFKMKGASISVQIALPLSFKPHLSGILKNFGVNLEGDGYIINDIECKVAYDQNFDADQVTSQKPFEEYFSEVIKSEKPDWVWTHYTDFFASTAALKWNASKTWIDITDNEFPRLEQLQQLPSIQSVYRSIQNILVASSFMEAEVQSSFSKARSLLLPNIIEDLSLGKVERKAEAWIFVNPVVVKGVEFVLQLAKILPEEKFIFVGNWGLEPPKDLPSNIEFAKRQASLRKIFSRAKGLLMPSVWQEAFGRVPLEAMAAGVPVISSDRGALPETVGSGGMVLPLETKRWTDAMGQSLESFIERGFQRVKDYQSQVQTAYKTAESIFWRGE